MNLFQDLRFAFRTLRKSPGFALSAIVALGLGIGANSAMFSIIDGVLLRPLPFPNSQNLVNVWETNFARKIPKMIAPPGNYYDWRAMNHVFSAIGAYRGNTFNLASKDNEPERFIGAICDPGFFATLQVRPLLGRTLTEEEDQEGRDGVVILGYGLWRQHFGGDPKIIGQNLLLDGRPRTVIGVMPEGFQYPAAATMWAPLVLDKESRTRRDFHQLRVIARLKDGVSSERARSEFQTIGAQLAQQYPDLNKDEGIAIN
ncbi:MAG: ABC transporter permease, partial [Acidobacteriota bacterium]|nr:ABC transporter permease [Acidobacteriota bacterium]